MNLPPTLRPPYRMLVDIPFTWHEKFAFSRFLAGDPDASRQEGFYSRLVYDPQQSEYCWQIVLYYRLQLVPYHINDYHPLFAYFDDTYRLLRVLYDAGHHRAMLAPKTIQCAFVVRFPWHGYRPGSSRFARPLRAASFDLTDDVLRSWWLQPGKPQFKLRSKFVDPWHPGLGLGDSVAKGSFRDEAVCPTCGAVEFLDTMDLIEGIFCLSLRCPRGHRFVACYDPNLMQMGSTTTAD